MPGYNEGNVFVISDFDEPLEQQLVPLTKEVKNQSRLSEGRIDMYVSSFGGYLYLAQHLIELIELAKGNGVVVRTIVPSIAASAGSIVAVTGTPGERYIARDAEHVVHYGTRYDRTQTPNQLDRSYESIVRSYKWVEKHYNKYCDIPNLESEIADDGFTLTAAKCIKYGLADKYLDKMELL